MKKFSKTISMEAMMEHVEIKTEERAFINCNATLFNYNEKKARRKLWYMKKSYNVSDESDFKYRKGK